MTTCIYCKGQDATPFDREHVIQQDFGRFIVPPALRLVDDDEMVVRSVCNPCNGYFGRELDWFLNRDSAEAILRSKHDPRLASAAGHIKSKRIRISINEPGQWYGARVSVNPSPNGELETELLPQVALRKKGEEKWHTFTIEQIVASKELEKYQTSSEVRIVGPSQPACEAVQKKLATIGIPFKVEGKMESIHQSLTPDESTFHASVEYSIDSTIMRGVGKIALNYLTYICGADFTLRSDFDPFRAFVRYGHQPAWKPVIPSNRPILANETPHWTCTDGHMLTVEWPPHGNAIIAQVSLFNNITYKVILCSHANGVWREIAAGHHFELSARRVSELKVVRRQLLPVPLMLRMARSLVAF